MADENFPNADHRVSAEDIRNLASSRRGQSYYELSSEERGTYRDVVATLSGISSQILLQLQARHNLAVKHTSGFTLGSGVRGRPPKDLWFAIYPKRNEQSLVANPQLFCIVSERGVEYGFGAVVHPSDFSNAATKAAVRETAPHVFSQLPDGSDPQAQALSATLEQAGGWNFQRKQRLTPGQSNFANLSDWLSFLKSDAGSKNAGGSISRFIVADELDEHDLATELMEMCETFLPLLDLDWKSPADLLRPSKSNEESELFGSPPEAELIAFADVFSEFLVQFQSHRDGPYSLQNNLGNAKQSLQSWLQNHQSVRSRSNLKVDISLGKGNWTKTPWVAFMDTRLTKSTTQGVYVVILIAEDLSVSFLTINQGMTELKDRLGQRGAVQAMLNVAERLRPQITQIHTAGFKLDNEIDLKSSTGAARNYEVGTIAHVSLSSEDLPGDDVFSRLLEAALQAYDKIVEAELTKLGTSENERETYMALEPYNIDDALEEVFCDRAELERYLAVWQIKKNFVLQGAPGVGKSFIAKRLAYLLLGERDQSRIQAVQFHQSYSYEDFVQGYRPNSESGFERRNGAFVDFRNRAANDPDRNYVFIIDEINRGNLSKIFGELMLLVETDKRSKDWATRLAYASEDEEKFWVPGNVFILGMMNTADRSLSMVDYALRRRFAFATMEPQFNSPKFATTLNNQGVTTDVSSKLISRMNQLNDAILEDVVNLGAGFRIGHSFFTPTNRISDPETWYRQIVETEIFPLLEEYWFDDPQVAMDWRDRLLAG